MIIHCFELFKDCYHDFEISEAQTRNMQWLF